jgi:hypothetical protein
VAKTAHTKTLGAEAIKLVRALAPAGEAVENLLMMERERITAKSVQDRLVAGGW